MTTARWLTVVCLATLAALLVSIAVGDFDTQRLAEARQAAIESARASSGVDGHTVARERDSHGR